MQYISYCHKASSSCCGSWKVVRHISRGFFGAENNGTERDRERVCVCVCVCVRTRMGTFQSGLCAAVIQMM
jgi:hypothetical protein